MRSKYKIADETYIRDLREKPSAGADLQAKAKRGLVTKSLAPVLSGETTKTCLLKQLFNTIKSLLC